MLRSRSHFLVACLSVVLGASAKAQQAPPAKPELDGATLFGQNCAACHGSDGRGGERAPNIATNREVVALADSQLHDIVSKGRLATGMPGFAAIGDDKVTALVAYLRTLQGMTDTGTAKLPGDASRGQTLFFGQGGCSHCHMVNGRGGYMSEDLSGYARGHSAQAVREAIAHPDAAGNTGHLVDLEIASGNTLRGLIRSEDNFTVVLQTEDGAYHSVARHSIRRSAVNSAPYAPQDYATRLDKQQMDDIVSYLLQTAATTKASPAKKDDDD